LRDACRCDRGIDDARLQIRARLDPAEFGLALEIRIFKVLGE
jgi:hypothetical protein